MAILKTHSNVSQVATINIISYYAGGTAVRLFDVAVGEKKHTFNPVEVLNSFLKTSYCTLFWRTDCVITLYSLRKKAYFSLVFNNCYLGKVKIQDTEIEWFKPPALLVVIK